MVKSETSLRSLGMTMVAVDKQLRADIKDLAAAKGKTSAEYLRDVIAEKKSQNPQVRFASISPRNDVSSLHSSLRAIESKVNAIWAYELLSKEDVRCLKGEVVKFIKEEDSSDAIEVSRQYREWAVKVVAGMSEDVKNALQQVLVVSSGQGQMPIT